MAQAVSFHWGLLGKPDFSKCAMLVERLPEQLRSRLKKPEEGTLKWITFLLWTYASHSGRGAAYCIPSQAFLARKVHRSERTVRRCLTVLREMKLISYLRRRPVQGEYRSNLYTLGRAFMAGLLYRLAPRSRVFTSGQKCPPITSRKEYESLTPTVTSDSHKIRSEIARQTETPLPNGRGLVGARSDEDTTPRQPREEWGRRVIKAWAEPEWMKQHPSELPPEPVQTPVVAQETVTQEAATPVAVPEGKYAIMERKAKELTERKAFLAKQIEQLKKRGDL